MNNTMKILMDDLLEQIKTTNEYNQYQALLTRIKNKEDLYQRICDYRKKSMYVQMCEGEEFIHRSNELQNEFSDLQSRGLVGEFFAAEHQYIAMIKELQNQFLEGSGIDTSFVE